MKKYSDLFIILLWTIISYIFVIIPTLENTIIRVVLGIPVILFIPGYVTIAALFPKRQSLRYIERIALSLGLSIAIIPLLSLILNYTHNIKLFPIWVTICIYTLVMVYIATHRRNKISDEERFSIGDDIGKFKNILLSYDKSLKGKVNIFLSIVILLLIIFATIGTIYFITATPKIGETFTEFYVLNGTGKAYYQTDLILNSPTAYIVGINNYEYYPTDYTVKMVLDNNTLLSEDIKLSHNEKIEKDITFIPDKVGNDMKLQFLLFKNNGTEPYRRLHLWVNITE